MRVAEIVGREIVARGVRKVFAVVGSGNFHFTTAMVASGADFVAARHEGGAMMMAGAYSMLTREVSAVSLHQGPGFTNAITGLVEAAKGSSPVIVMSAASVDPASNFWIDQMAVVASLGVRTLELTSAKDAQIIAAEAVRMAEDGGVVFLNLPTDVQDEVVEENVVFSATAGTSPCQRYNAPDIKTAPDFDLFRKAIVSAKRPVFLVGMGGAAESARISAIADHVGALLATSAPARGLFSGSPWSLDVSGGYSSPGTWNLLLESDLIVAWGASLNRWTTQEGSLLRGRTVLQIDNRADAFGFHYPVDHEVHAEISTYLDAITENLGQIRSSIGARTETNRLRIGATVPWRNHPYDDSSTAERIDPRKATIAINELIRKDRVVVTDGGNFNGYPAMFFDVPDGSGTCHPLWFQSIGLGMAASIGACLSQPQRTVVLGVGDGGFLMSHVELETAVRLKLDLAIVVYNDNAYGAEVHHFGPMGYPVDIVTFPETDLAELARGYGCDAIAVRTLDDLDQLGTRLQVPGHGPLLIDIRITSFPSWVLSHTFTGE